MRALIINSGMGTRMKDMTKQKPKCMTKIKTGETILSRQLNILLKNNITDVVMTTGYLKNDLKTYCENLNIPINFTFIKNDLYMKTNYIYSVYLAKEHLQDDIVFLHGDLVFDELVFKNVLNEKKSVVTVSSKVPLPEKDFKAVVKNSQVEKIGINFFDNALTCQPLYKLNKIDWLVWLDSIIDFCNNNKTDVYAENAFNEVSSKCKIYTYDYLDMLCNEVDNQEDLEIVNKLI